MTAPKQANSAWYRVSQFLAALKALLPGKMDGELAGAEALLAAILPTASQRELFERMPPNDQSHALAVAYTLQQAGYQERALIQAALLHDVGKSICQPLIHRAIIVLLTAFWPAALRMLASPRESTALPFGYGPIELEDIWRKVAWWRRPFVVHARHASIGAAWARAAACDPLAIRLINRHQDVVDPASTGAEDQLLAALQWADNLN